MHCPAQLSILPARAFYMKLRPHGNPRPLQRACGSPPQVVLFDVAVCPGTSRRRSGEISSMSSSRNSAPCCLATPGRWTSPPSCRKASISCVNTRVGTRVRPSPSCHFLFTVETSSVCFWLLRLLLDEPLGRFLVDVWSQRSYGRRFDLVLWSLLWRVYSLITLAVLIAWPMHYFLKLL